MKDFMVPIIVITVLVAIVIGLLALYNINTQETDEGIRYRIIQIEGMDCIERYNYNIYGITCDWDMRQK